MGIYILFTLVSIAIASSSGWYVRSDLWR
jgi:hypothetical protein